MEDSAICKAILDKNPEKVLELLSDASTEDLSVRDEQGRNFAHLALAHLSNAQERLYEIIKTLVMKGVDLSQRDKELNSVLDLIIKAVGLESVKENIIKPLLQAGLDTPLRQIINAGGDTSPLFKGLGEGLGQDLPEETKALLQNILHYKETVDHMHAAFVGGDFVAIKKVLTPELLCEARNDLGLTPVHFAVVAKNETLLKTMLQECPQVVNATDFLGRTSFHYASAMKNMDSFLSILKEAGADATITDLCGKTAGDYSQNPELLDMDKVIGIIQSLVKQANPKAVGSKIAKAIKDKDSVKAHELICDASPADLKVRDNKGRNLAHLTLEFLAGTEKFHEVFQTLLKKGINLSEREKELKSVIDLAVKVAGLEKVKENIIKQLFLDGCETQLCQIINAGGDTTPLFAGLEENLPEEAKALYQKIGKYKETVDHMHTTFRGGDLGAIKKVMTPELLCEARNDLGLTPVHFAVVAENQTLLKTMLQECPQVVNATDYLGRTSLHYACALKAEGFLKILREAKADETISDLCGKTAADYCEDPGLLDMDKVIGIIQSIVKKAPTNPPKPIGPKKHKPVEVYVSKNGERHVPPPSTVEGQYLSQNLGTALTMALAEVAEHRPKDPIEYLAQWLYKYRENVLFVKKQADMLKALRDEEAKRNEEEILKFKRREELRRIQEEEAEKRRIEEEERKKREQEELQRSTKEAALAQRPALPTVTEDEEAEAEGNGGAARQDDDPSVKDRDSNGLTEMHKLASQQGMDLQALISLGYSVADRDLQGRTVKDVALAAGQQETVDAIDDYLQRLVEDGRTDVLEELTLEGLPELEELVREDMPDSTNAAMARLSEIKEHIIVAMKAARAGEELEVSDALDKTPELIRAKDKDGCSLLHCAVLSNSESLVQRLALNYPELIKSRDNGNRTPLHYAQAVSPSIAAFLISRGASERALDLMKRTPNEYTPGSAGFEAIKASLGLKSPVQEEKQQMQETEQQNVELSVASTNEGNSTLEESVINGDGPDSSLTDQDTTQIATISTDDLAEGCN